MLKHIVFGIPVSGLIAAPILLALGSELGLAILFGIVDTMISIIFFGIMYND